METKELLKDEKYRRLAIWMNAHNLTHQADCLTYDVELMAFWDKCPAVIEAIAVSSFNYNFDDDCENDYEYEVTSIKLVDDEELVQKFIEEYREKRFYTWETREDVMRDSRFLAELVELVNNFSLAWKGDVVAKSSRKDVPGLETVIKEYKRIVKEHYECMMNLV